MSGEKRSSGPRLDHVAIAVEDLRAACAKYERLLGVPPSEIEEVASEKVRLAFFQVGDCRIELLEGTAEDSPISRFLASGRRGVHHLAFTAGNGGLAAVFESLRAEGVEVLGDGIRRGSGGSEIFFVHPRASDGVLIEFTGHEK